jgi:hypothetical protein
MIRDIVEAQATEEYRLLVRFEDGVSGVVDLERLTRFEGVFAPLRDREQFRRVRVNPELGTVCWPGGADLDPVVLYALVTGRTLSYSELDVTLPI